MQKLTAFCDMARTRIYSALMKARSLAACAFAALAGLAGLAGCGGGGKPAESAGNCPAGTTLKGSDCLPNDDAPKGDDASPSKTSATHDEDSPPSSGSGSGGSGGGGSSSSPSSTPATPYDKDAVDIELKRAARQVKGNCGAATDENGSATGPWGKFNANIVLGRNGHIKTVTIPPEYDGKPAGVCVVHAFQKIQFPPYAASSDSAIDFEIEISKPKK